MASRMASTCDHYAAGCTKTEPEILQVKRGQKWRNAPGLGRKRRNRVRFGCWRGVKPVRTGEEPQNPNQNAPHSHATHEKRKPAKPQCFRRFFGRGRRTCLGCRLGCCSPVGSAQHRPRREPRPARQSATGARSPHDTHCAGRSHASLPSPYAR